MAADSDIEVRRAQEAAANSLKQLSTNASNAAKSLSGELGKAVTATETSFADLAKPLSLVTKSMSAVASAASTLAAGIPFVGGAMRAMSEGVRLAGEVAVGAIEMLGPIMDQHLKIFRETSHVGGLVNNSFTKMGETATKSGLLWAEFGKIVATNSQSFIYLGKSVSGGTQLMADTVQKLKSGTGTAYQSLLNLGYAQDEIAEFTVKQAEWEKRNNTGKHLDAQSLATSTHKYLEELDTISRITGMNRKDMIKDREEKMKEMRWRATLAGMDVEHAKTAAAAVTAMARFGPEAQTGIMDLISTGGIPLTEAGVGLLALMPELDKLAAGVRNGTVSVDQFNAGIGEAAKRSMVNNKALMEVTPYIKDANSRVVVAMQGVVADMAAAASFSSEGVKNAREATQNQGESLDEGARNLLAAQEAQRGYYQVLDEQTKKMMPAVTKAFETLADTTATIVKGIVDLLNAALDQINNTGTEELGKQLEAATAQANEGKGFFERLFRRQTDEERKIRDKIAVAKGEYSTQVEEWTGATLEDNRAEAKKKQEELLRPDRKEKPPAAPAVDPAVSAGTEGRANGGISTGPTSGYTELLHGIEAVVPLPDGKTIPVAMSSDSFTPLLAAYSNVNDSVSMMMNKPAPAITVDNTAGNAQMSKTLSLVKSSIDRIDLSQVKEPALPRVQAILDKNTIVLETARSQQRNDDQKTQELLSAIKSSMEELTKKQPQATDNKSLEDKITEMISVLKEQTVLATTSTELQEKALRSLADQTRISKNILSASS